jgi:hypothetical protein
MFHINPQMQFSKTTTMPHSELELFNLGFKSIKINFSNFLA